MTLCSLHIDEIADLLTRRSGTEPAGYEARTERIARQLAEGRRIDEVLARLTDDVVRNEYAASLGVLADLEELGISPPDAVEGAEVIEPSRRRPVRLQTVLYAASGIAAAVIVALSVLFTGAFDRQLGDESPRFVVKGTGDDFQVAVQRGASQFRLRPNDKLAAGDAMGFFYSTASDSYLAIFNVDANLAATPLFPLNDNQSRLIRKGEEWPIADGAKVTSSQGCEWLVAVFSDQPLALGAIGRQLTEQKKSAAGCEANLKIEGARTVYLVPFKQ